MRYRKTLLAALSAVVLATGGAAQACTGNLVQNPSTEDGNPPTCYQGVGSGTNTYTFSTSTTAHTGTRSLKLSIGRIFDGERTYLTSRSKNCAPDVTEGRSYALGVWVNANSTRNALTVYRHVTAGGDRDKGWVRWTELKVIGNTKGWVHLTANTPPIPDGTDKLAFGVSSSTIGTLLTDDYSMTER